MRLVRVVAVILVVLLSASAGAAPTAASATSAIVTAATAFLATLTPAQRASVQFAFARPKAARAARFKGGMNGRMTFTGEQYGSAVWSNFPVSDVPRPGLTVGSLDARQHEALLHLVRAALSAKGYQKVLDIMGADQQLADGGTHFAAGRAHYLVALFGTPSATTPWMIEFGGHHLALNITIAGAKGTLAPSLTGAQPALYRDHGRIVRPLAAENDKAFALLDALDANQRQQAILGYAVDDLVLGPGHQGETLAPEGVRAQTFDAHQRALLIDLIGEWAGIIRDDYLAPRLDECRAGLDDTYFAWSGPTTHEPGRNGAAYYRIQGPKVFIELSPQGVGGDSTMHVHTIYRDPTNDYGRAWP